MRKQRFVFDLDRTLMTSSPDLEFEYFQSIFGEERGKEFIEQMPAVLDVYENQFPKYDIQLLSDFMTSEMDFYVTPKIVNDWIHILADVEDTKEMDVDSVLDYLKGKGYSLAVLTNWFRDTQVPRLKKAGLLPYFDQVYTGDTSLKPHKESFIAARGNFHPDECVFIGDNVNRDYIGPRACGMHSILYDKDDKHHRTLQKIKRLNELTNRY